MKALKLDHFDSWAATFGEPVSAMELAPGRLGLPAQHALCPVHQRAGTHAAVPAGRRHSNRDKCSSCPSRICEREKPTIRQCALLAGIEKDCRSHWSSGRRRCARGRIDPREDNMLKITTDGRKAALDLRLMNPSARTTRTAKSIWPWTRSNASGRDDGRATRRNLSSAICPCRQGSRLLGLSRHARQVGGARRARRGNRVHSGL